MNDRELNDAELESISGGLVKSSSAGTTRPQPVRNMVRTFAPVASGFGPATSVASASASAPSSGGGDCAGGVCRI